MANFPLIIILLAFIHWPVVFGGGEIPSETSVSESEHTDELSPTPDDQQEEWSGLAKNGKNLKI